MKTIIARLLALYLIAAPAARGERLTAPGSHLRDAEGRAVILRGINMINKGPDYVPWHGPEQFRKVRSWGMNCIRLGILWAGVEPEPGVYDDIYLDRMIELAGQMGEEGLHVILDFHQDIYSEYFGGDGAPEWAVRDGGIPYDPRDSWFMNYFEPAVQHAFGAFWADEYGIQARFHEMIAYTANRFRDEPAVIGIELMNEPWPEPMVGILFDPTYMEPFLRRGHEAVSSAAAGLLTFWEPRVLTNWGFPSYISSHPEHDWVMAPHYYDPATESEWGYPGVGTLMTLAMTRRATERERMKDPVWVGEYGCSWQMPGVREYYEDLQGLFDQFAFGSAFWDYTRSEEGWGVEYPDGSELPVVDVLVRPGPVRTAGTPLSFGIVPFTRRWKFTWTGGNGIDAPTEIFVPLARHYPDGFRVRSTDLPGTWSWEWNEEDEIMSVRHDQSRLSRTLTIVPN